MSKPPIKAMEAVQRYCAKRKTCEGCSLNNFNEYGYKLCFKSPESWEIEKDGDRNDAKRT